MTQRLAIIAGQGTLPLDIARAAPDALYVTFEGVDSRLAENEHLSVRYERLGQLFEALKEREIDTLVFAGAMTRPALDPSRFDEKTLSVMPAIMGAFGKGDDALLRAVIAVFEAEGFVVVAAHDVAPDLVMGADLVKGREPSDAERKDGRYASEILATISPLDIAQSCVVEAGLCLGIESIQGTDALLRFVGETPQHLRRPSRGVLLKTAKLGQDLRVDMPAIGPATIRGVHKAGLAGLFIGAGKVIVLEQEEVFRLIEKHGLFLATL